ncbi:hypothetical protein BBD42_28640 [Paenibacillus sp. BIHB 4019]|uniref:DNA-binding response regulator n=1 Tax=Paenibacillus sp. BIHB 4019 TaxID=1870819 RepID=A0A1B2DQQ0_9BACL|nr:response regulator [Paenibacillus sp. BIHB 4019]ANY70027.1 hypothetical protein BBD42_28640 [Paenibacillus sp. BIHB 4019]
MKIIVVEDEANSREGIVRLIEKISPTYKIVAEAENGQEGYECIDRMRPDLVITDIKMPVMSGIEMLDKLKVKGHTHKTIVLTGFSEFEYAKKALQLGVVDYLEKPITASDIRSSLLKIEQELLDQQLLGLPNLPLVDQAEYLIVKTLTHDDVDPYLVCRYLERTISINPNRSFQIIQWYAGSSFLEVSAEIKSTLKEKLSLWNTASWLLFVNAPDQSVNLLIEQNDLLIEQLLASIKMESQVTISMVQIGHLIDLRDGYRKLRHNRKWSIIDTDIAVYSENEIERLKRKPFHYPEQLDNRIKSAITDSNRELLQQVFRDWNHYCYSALYHPQQIIDATVRFISTLLSLLAAEYGDEVAFKRQNEWLDRIQSVQMKSEFIHALLSIEDQTAALFKKDKVYSLSVNKALQLIHGRYMEGITLDEIASLLRITPEYLSTLFNKEVGKSYSTYMKEMRINLAKQLLIHSEMKVFEIAQQIGYPDAKYFSRVFRDSMGISPVEYQRINKK